MKRSGRSSRLFENRGKFPGSFPSQEEPKETRLLLWVNVSKRQEARRRISRRCFPHGWRTVAVEASWKRRLPSPSLGNTESAAILRVIVHGELEYVGSRGEGRFQASPGVVFRLSERAVLCKSTFLRALKRGLRTVDRYGLFRQRLQSENVRMLFTQNFDAQSDRGN